MKRLVMVWVAAVVLGGCASGGGPETGVFLKGTLTTEEFVSFEAPYEDWRYLMWFPPAYAERTNDEFPLIVFLHGSGDADFDEVWVQSYGLPEVLDFGPIPDNFEFVVLAPQAGPGTSWWAGRQPEAVGALVEQAIADYRIDPTRVYVTGISMGGYGSWHAAVDRPDLYAAVVSVSGSGFGMAELPEGFQPCAMADIPVLAVHGAEDPISLPEANLALIAGYEQECGTSVEVRMLPDQGHFGTFVEAYRDPSIYDWMLSHTR
jgi:predicted peptidase